MLVNGGFESTQDGRPLPSRTQGGNLPSDRCTVTRARRVLHLIGHTARRDQRAGSPAAGSLLQKLWSAVKADFEAASVGAPAQDEREEEEAPPAAATPRAVLLPPLASAGQAPPRTRSEPATVPTSGAAASRSTRPRIAAVAAVAVAAATKR